ncbi:MAG: ThiF family adenylyltransferase [Bacteroidota bacterium]
MSESNNEKTLKIQTTKAEHWDSTFQLISWWKSEQVQSSKVMVVGAGALGNEVLKNLALLNVGHILIIDFDHIEFSNLSRSVLFRPEDAEQRRPKAEVAATRIREMNPNVKVMTIAGDIGVDVGLGVFRRMDAVIGCLDNRLARLYINRHCFKVDKAWIDGAIENLAGQMEVYKPGISCYECQLSPAEWENIRFRLGCPDIAERNKAQGRIPTTPISSSIIAAMQVQEALKIIHNNDEKLLVGKRFRYEGMNNDVLIYESHVLRDECESHVEDLNIVDMDQLSARMTISELFEVLIEHFGTEEIKLWLDHEVVLELTSMKSEESYEVMVATPHLSESMLEQYRTIAGEQIGITKSVKIIGKDDLDGKTVLKDIGIPFLHVITVEANFEFHYLELSGDVDFLQFQ